MASNFNSSKYKETFEKRFGSGSYESGLSKARDIGKSKASAGIAKDDYQRRMSEAKEAFDKAEREREKVKKEEVKEKKKKDEEKAFYDLLEENKKSKENKPLIPKKITKPIKDMFSDFTKSFKDDKNKDNDLSKMDRFNRSLAQLTNGIALDIPKQIHKKLSKETDSKFIDDTYDKFYGKKKGTKVTDVANNMAGYLVPGVGISKGLKGTAVGAKGVSEALSTKLTKESAKKVVKETAKEGAAVGGIMAGTEIAARETLNPDDYNWKQNLGQFGLEVGAGAILDPALTLGAGKMINRFKKPPAGGKSVDNLDDIAEGPTPFDVEEPNLPARTEVAATTSKPRHSIDTLMKSYKGQDVSDVSIKPKVSRPSPNDSFEKKLAYWRNNNNPIGEDDIADIYKHMQDIEANTSKMKDPNSPEHKQIVERHQKINPAFKQKRLELDNIKSELQNVMNRDQEWQNVKLSQDAFKLKNRPEEMKFIIPKDERMDYEAVPKRFRGTKNTASMDIHEAATIAGYKSVDEYVTYLQGIDRLLSKTRNYFRLPSPKYISDLTQNEKRLSKEINDVTNKLTKTHDNESLIDELSKLMSPRKGYTAPIKSEQSMKFREIDEMFGGTSPKNDIVDDVPLKENKFTEGYDVTKMKDLSGFNAATSDVYRNFDKAFGKDSNITKRVLGELDDSKARNINMQERLLNDLNEKVVKGLGITKGSKLSRYVQDYGEKNMNLATLMDKAPNDWEKVVKADEWFQQTYRATLNEMNLARAKAYPGDKSKIVPERKDYYRHYTELSGLSGLKNIFDSPSAISPHLAGTSEFTKPGSKYAGFMQKRGLGPYKSDAVGGFLNYVPSAAYATHIDPNIPNFRGLKNELADMTEDTKNMNGVIEYLHDYANDLAGKTNPHLDRWVQKVIPGGRTTMGAVSWLNNRVKTNTILGNLGSALAQVANIPNGLAFAKQHSVKGLGRSMKGIMDMSEPIHKSPFLKERYSSQMYRQFDQKMLDQPQKMAEWLIETADKVGTSFVWNSSYEKGLSQGVTNPIKYADENTRRLIAGRGVGEVPLLQKSKVVQTIIPFTLEVGNAWRVIFDMTKGKDAAGIAILFTANHVLNNITEELRGSPVTFDPIDAMLESANDELSPLQTAGRLGGEILSNVPAGQFLAGAYPEYGDIAGFKGPTREEIFGDRNPQRFGTGLVAANGISDPLFKVLPSFGGNQLKKSLGGLEIMKNGGSYKDGKGIMNAFPFMGENKELKFPVEMSKEDKIKMSLFGPYATDNAREYFDEERRPLSEKQTDEFKEAEARGLGQESYEYLMDKRVVDTEKSKINKAKKSIKEIQEDTTLTDIERKKAIAEVLKILELK